MQFKYGQKNLSIDGFKSSFAGIILVANTFIWFLYGSRLLSQITVNSGLSSFEVAVVWCMTIFGIVVASIFGSVIFNKPKTKTRIIQYWMLAGIPLSLIPLAMDISAISNLIVFFTLVGVYFGLGMPLSLSYFASKTSEINRARFGGITFLTIFVGVMILGALGVTSLELNSIVLAAIKLIGLIITLKIKPTKEQDDIKEPVYYKQVVKNRTFILYFVPWIMFSIANYIATPVVSQIFPNIFEASMMAENIVAAIFAIISGFLADYFGRRRIVLLGFILLGMGYASLGLFPENIAGWWFYTAVDGVAWGIFYTVFLMTIWGDIALERNSEKFYAIGYLPFLFSILTELSFGSAITSTISSAAIFSFTSLFLFVAVLPLAYAPETLPSQVLKNRELKSYIEKAQRKKNGE